MEDATLKEFCWDSYIKFVYQITTIVAFALVVAIVNFILKYILRKFGKYFRYPTITAETFGITMNLFRAMFINTAILTLLF